MPLELVLPVIFLTAAAIASALTLWVVRATVQRQARRSGSPAGARGVWWVAWISFIPALSVGAFAAEKLVSALWRTGFDQRSLELVLVSVAMGLAAALLIWL